MPILEGENLGGASDTRLARWLSLFSEDHPIRRVLLMLGQFSALTLISYVLFTLGLAAYRYWHVKQALLSSGISVPVAALVAQTIMLGAASLSVFALVRILFWKPRKLDFVAVLLLPIFDVFVSFIPTNFDAVGGTPRQWCAVRPDGTRYCSDHEGFDPLIGTKLEPIDGLVAEDLYCIKNKCPDPQRLMANPRMIEFFRARGKHAEPKVWVSKDKSDCYDLFDRPGINPSTGQKLEPVLPGMIEGILACWDRKESRQADDARNRAAQETQERESRRLAEEAEARSRQQAEDEKRVREIEAERQRAEIAERQRIAEASRKPPVISDLYAALGSCSGTPTKIVPQTGFYVCGKFASPAARGYRGQVTVESGANIFGQRASGTDGFTISPGAENFNAGPWTGLSPGVYTLTMVVEGAEIGRMQFTVN